MDWFDSQLARALIVLKQLEGCVGWESNRSNRSIGLGCGSAAADDGDGASDGYVSGRPRGLEIRGRWGQMGPQNIVARDHGARNTSAKDALPAGLSGLGSGARCCFLQAAASGRGLVNGRTGTMHTRLPARHPSQKQKQGAAAAAVQRPSSSARHGQEGAGWAATAGALQAFQVSPSD